MRFVVRIDHYIAISFIFFPLFLNTVHYLTFLLDISFTHSLSLSLSLFLSSGCTSYRFISNSNRCSSLSSRLQEFSKNLKNDRVVDYRTLSSLFSVFIPRRASLKPRHSLFGNYKYFRGLAPPSSTVRSSSNLVFTLLSSFERRSTRAPASSFPLGSFASLLCRTELRVVGSEKETEKKKERNPARRKRPTNVTHEDRHRSP